jgi:hypothetical protein
MLEGRLLWVWGFLYAVTKFPSEALRGDSRFPVAGPFTAAMLVEIATALACAAVLGWPALWDRLVARPREEPPAAPFVTRALRLALEWVKPVPALLAAAVGAALAGPVAALAAWVGLYVLFSLLAPLSPALRAGASRLAEPSGRAPGVVRLLWRGIVDAAAPLTLFAALRPALDPGGRTMADAAAGLRVVPRAGSAPDPLPQPVPPL